MERKNPDIGVEVIDLRSLAPFDWNAIRTSVEKTNRVIVAHEDCRSFGYAAEIAARIADELFDRLDAPVRRVAALDTRVAYQPQVENAIFAAGGRSGRRDGAGAGVLTVGQTSRSARVLQDPPFGGAKSMSWYDHTGSMKCLPLNV